MAAKQSLTEQAKLKCEQALVDGLKQRGRHASVELEKSGLPGKYRLFVISKHFEKLVEAERQDLVWQVLKEKWPRKDQLRLTLTLTLTKNEAEGSWA